MAPPGLRTRRRSGRRALALVVLLTCGVGAVGTPSGAATVAVAPGQPGTPTVTPVAGGLSVAWTAPLTGGPVQKYRAVASPAGGGCNASAGALSCTIRRLPLGTPETVTVDASGPGRAGTGPTSSASSPVAPLPTAGARYAIALGDSFAAGANVTPGQGYVDLLAAHEATRIHGLVLQNDACGGASTASMLVAGNCDPSASQVEEAVALMEAHPNHVAYVTITVGLNDLGRCEAPLSIDPVCAQAALATMSANLTTIVSDLRAAGPKVPIIGMTEYDPLLGAWVLGSPSAATSSLAEFPQFSDALTSTYTNGGALVADVATAFQTDDQALTGSFDGVTVPQDVADICNWTGFCTGTDPGTNSHPNATGYQVIADTFEPVVDGATK